MKRQQRSWSAYYRPRHADLSAESFGVRVASGASASAAFAAFVLVLVSSHSSSSDAYTHTVRADAAFVGSRCRVIAAARVTRPQALCRVERALKLHMVDGSLDGGRLDTGIRAISEGLSSAQNSLPRVSLPNVDLPDFPKNTPLLDVLLKLSLPDFSMASANGQSGSSLLELSSSLTDGIASSTSNFGAQVSQASRDAVSALPLTPDKLDHLTADAVDAAAQTSVRVSQALDAFAAANPALRPALDRLEASLTHAGAALGETWLAGYTLLPEELHPVIITLALGAASTALGAALAAAREESLLKEEAKNAPLPTDYDLPAIMGYYNRRPLTLISRLAEVSLRLGSLGVKLWLDKKIGDGSGWERNMESRAAEFLDFVQGAGPAFIKIGQGVSIRPDILPEPYLRELSKLQDRVKPFDSGEAREILARQLGQPLSEVFQDADTAFDLPIAAASLGQVYRAMLVTGERVAVKVQRPDVLKSVTLDLYVIRILLLFLSKNKSTRESALSILGVIDNWANRFLEELDYLQEAANGDRFRTEMAASATLGEAIIVPRVFSSLTSRYVLVTEWVEGVKVDAIDSTTEEGRERLKKIIATLLNSYLAQLLESGFLHADPHPGNFLCTPDGKLCVLDMGLMTEVAEDQRYALLEYVSHLIAKDYEATLNDLIVLGFIPREIGDDPDKAAVVVPLLATVLEQLSNGGGAKSITVESVGEEVEQLGREYPIVIPAYFGLIIRAFSALEGLGLRLEPQYSIVKECFPYLARRLLTEDSDRMRKMLRTFLYGKEDRFLQVDRVDELVEGYSQFTALADEASKGVTVAGVKDPLGRQPMLSTNGPPLRDHQTALPSSRGAIFGGGDVGGRSPVFAAAGAGSGFPAASGVDGDKRAMDPVQDPVARDALKLLFSKEGNYVQELVVEELVRMTDALSRESNLQIVRALRTLTEAPLSPARIARVLAEARLNPLLAPLQVPFKAQTYALSRVFNRLEVALELSQEDEESLKALRRLQELLLGGVDNGDLEREEGRSSSPFPQGIPFPIPAVFPSLLPRGPGMGAVGPREAVDAARQAAGLATMIGPGVVTIVQNFLVQLTARTLDRLADSLDGQRKADPSSAQASAAQTQGRGRFYADE